MKKLLIGAAAVLMMMGAVSCDNSGADKSKSVLEPEQNDSLVAAHAALIGYMVNGELQQMMAADSTFNKDEVLKGMQYAFAADTTSGYNYGIQVGMAMANAFKQMRAMGIVVDQSEWFNLFKNVFKTDSVVGQPELMQMQQEMQRWTQKAQDVKKQQEIDAILNSDQAKANLAQAQKYIADAKAKDASIKDGADGAAFKIENAGEGKIADNDKVTLKVNVKALNGENPQPIPSTPMFVGTLPNGLKDGVKMLGKGGKGTFYIPQTLVYDVLMAQRMGLEPNTLYIYEVEVLDVEGPEAAGAKADAKPAVQVPAQVKK